jgi:hypothetical protein
MFVKHATKIFFRLTIVNQVKCLVNGEAKHAYVRDDQNISHLGRSRADWSQMESGRRGRPGVRRARRI